MHFLVARKAKSSGQVGGYPIKGDNDCTLESQNGCVFVELGRALFGNFPSLVAL